MKGNFLYCSKITNPAAVRERLKNCSESYVLCGEYGLSPFLLTRDEISAKRLLYEVVLSNKNRNLFCDTILSAHAARFCGIVISSGSFEKTLSMPMPVFDLDVTQALSLATSLRKNGKIAPDFLLGVRAPSGSEAAEYRARYLIELGADFIVPSVSIAGLEERTMMCIEEFTA
ncbi:MAG: hypothetical protein N2316_05725 [Spirochaetes bacterium]|nr:hypothetical protein [Spirochaetota bacterium]